MKETLKQAFLKREYAGFVLALTALFIIDRLADPYGTLLSFVLIYGGLALTRKWFH